MTSRRNFLQKSATLAGLFPFTNFWNPLAAAEFEEQVNNISKQSLSESIVNEDFWGWIRESFTVSPSIINLNNGGVSPQPKVVQDAHIRYYQMCNEGPSYYMWRILDQGRESLRQKLATLGGCSTEEIAINRNSTEGLNTIIFGLDLKAGDEVLLSKYDYPNMMNAWKQREKRDGIKLNWITFDLPQESDEYFIEKYKKAITSKTKVVHLTHMINWTGQLLPVQKLADLAHQHGCEVILDSAHTFAHIDFSFPDTHCDYAATSLHKWLSAPFGSGLLYIKKDKIKNVWALLSSVDPSGTDIRKFESLGTRSFASEMAIGQALDFHNVIGTKRKEERLRYLKNYWCEKALSIPGFKLNISLKPKYSCALSNFSIEGVKPEDIEAMLMDKFKIHTVPINWEGTQGVRVTPHVYTNLADLDRLIEGIKYISKNRS